jgi:hypothetical protein
MLPTCLQDVSASRTLMIDTRLPVRIEGTFFDIAGKFLIARKIWKGPRAWLTARRALRCATP